MKRGFFTVFICVDLRSAIPFASPPQMCYNLSHAADGVLRGPPFGNAPFVVTIQRTSDAGNQKHHRPG